MSHERGFMKVQYCSDIHLEFPQNKKYLTKNPIKPTGDILILAGDTCHFSEYAFGQKFFDDISKNYEMVFLIPGNHEFYGGKDISITDEPVRQQIRENIWLYNNVSTVYRNVEFIFTTLWSMISMKASRAIKQYMADFRYIKYQGNIIDITDYNLLHQRALQFLERAISNSNTNKKVVITHHLPSVLCNVEEFKNSPYNEAFCVDLTELIENSNINYWIFGHSHRNVPHINLNGTTLITNQLGYVSMNEHQTFKRDAYFNL